MSEIAYEISLKRGVQERGAKFDAEPDLLLATVKAIASGDYQDPETLISLARECLDVIND